MLDRPLHVPKCEENMNGYACLTGDGREPETVTGLWVESALSASAV